MHRNNNNNYGGACVLVYKTCQKQDLVNQVFSTVSLLSAISKRQLAHRVFIYMDFKEAIITEMTSKSRLLGEETISLHTG